MPGCTLGLAPSMVLTSDKPSFPGSPNHPKRRLPLDLADYLKTSSNSTLPWLVVFVVALTASAAVSCTMPSFSSFS